MANPILLDSAVPATPPLVAGTIVALNGRWLRVSGMPDGTICRDYRHRIAVRNVATNRLSYIPRSRLLNAPRVTVAESSAPDNAVTPTAAELLAAVRKVLEGFESGVFIRDTRRDLEPAWSIRLLPYIAALSTLARAVEASQ